VISKGHPIFLPMKELFEKVSQSESTKHIWRNDYNSEEWRNANTLNRHLFGMSLNQSAGCQCIEDLFLMLKRESTKTKIMNQFKLRKNSVITSFLHPTITEHSTDAEFIAMLKVSPASIKYFVQFPENWKEIVNGKQILPTVKEMREQLKVKGVKVPRGTKQPELIELWQKSK
jgi:hypothetical protein